MSRIVSRLLLRYLIVMIAVSFLIGFIAASREQTNSRSTKQVGLMNNFFGYKNRMLKNNQTLLHSLMNGGSLTGAGRFSHSKNMSEFARYPTYFKVTTNVPGKLYGHYNTKNDNLHNSDRKKIKLVPPYDMRHQLGHNFLMPSVNGHTVFHHVPFRKQDNSIGLILSKPRFFIRDDKKNRRKINHVDYAAAGPGRRGVSELENAAIFKEAVGKIVYKLLNVLADNERHTTLGNCNSSLETNVMMQGLLEKHISDNSTSNSKNVNEVYTRSLIEEAHNHEVPLDIIQKFRNDDERTSDFLRPIAKMNTVPSTNEISSVSEIRSDGGVIDSITFNKFVTETLNFEKQAAAEVSRLDSLIRQLAVAAQTDFASVTERMGSLKQRLAGLQEQSARAWKTMNDTHVNDLDLLNGELHGIKTDVFRLHALVTGVTPLGQSTSQDKIAEMRQEKRTDATMPAFGTDCASLYLSGVNVSGVFELQLPSGINDSRKIISAYCDMETDGGGWTVFQRRRDGSDDFFRGWTSYKLGFGSFLHDYWLGLENIHLLTNYGNNVMRIDLTDWENKTRWAEFRVMDESDGYRILVGGYRGNAGDPFHSLSYDMRMQSMRFSTFDSDNDLDSTGNCALTFTSGWWFNKCFLANLNGVWYGSSRYAGPSMNGIVWDLWSEHFDGYSLKQTEMKLRQSGAGLQV